MTNDELEQIMNFIIERHERLGERLDRIAEETTRQIEVGNQLQESAKQQRELANVLLDTQVALTENIERLVAKDAAQDQRLAEQNERIARLERSYTIIVNLLQKHDTQIITLTDNGNRTNEVMTALIEQVAAVTNRIDRVTERVDRLTTTVERYINTRGTNGDKLE